MSKLFEVKPDEFDVSPFRLIGREWMLVLAEREGKANAMTASWGGLGVMWRKDVAFVVIRPQRYTKEFVDGSETFSLNFFDAYYRKALDYFGSHSGRDGDKIAKTGLTLAHADGAPHFAEASTVILCRKLYAQPFVPEGFIDPEPDRDCYPDKDYHTLYIAEVLHILARKLR